MEKRSDIIRVAFLGKQTHSTWYHQIRVTDRWVDQLENYCHHDQESEIKVAAIGIKSNEWNGSDSVKFGIGCGCNVKKDEPTVAEVSRLPTSDQQNVNAMEAGAGR